MTPGVFLNLKKSILSVYNCSKLMFLILTYCTYNLEVHENLKSELIKNKNMRMYASFLTSAVFLLVSFKRALEAAR